MLLAGIRQAMRLQFSSGVTMNDIGDFNRLHDLKYNHTVGLSHGRVFKLVLKKGSLGVDSFALVRDHSLRHVWYWWARFCEAAFTVDVPWILFVNRITHPYTCMSSDEFDLVCNLLVPMISCMTSFCKMALQKDHMGRNHVWKRSDPPSRNLDL